MKRLELLILPPLVMLLAGLIMWLLSRAFPTTESLSTPAIDRISAGNIS